MSSNRIFNSSIVTTYQGSELEIFGNANRWKSYWASRLKPFVSGRVLDVGAGIGSSIEALANPHITDWHAMEPDPDLAEKISTSAPFPVQVSRGHLRDMAGSYDTILYIDVMEHIEQDAREVDAAITLLNPGGHLVVLSPAHQFLMSPFDLAIGHYRRYDETMIKALTSSNAKLVHTEYLDSIGMFASLANKLLLRQSQPSAGQINFWDRFMIPVSRVLDPLTMRKIGKTIIAVWQK